MMVSVRTEEGERRARQGLEVAHEIGDRACTLATLAAMACAAAERGDADRAGALWASIRVEDEQGRRPSMARRSRRLRAASRVPFKGQTGTVETMHRPPALRTQRALGSILSILCGDLVRNVHPLSLGPFPDSPRPHASDPADPGKVGSWIRSLIARPEGGARC